MPSQLVTVASKYLKEMDGSNMYLLSEHIFCFQLSPRASSGFGWTATLHKIKSGVANTKSAIGKFKIGIWGSRTVIGYSL